MKHVVSILAGVAAFATPSACLAQATGSRPPAPIVYFDIAGPADSKLAPFYEKVFGWREGPGGVVTVPVSSPKLSGTLRADPAAKVLYIGVPDVAATLQEVTASGGKIVAPRFEVKGVVVLGLFADPAGNVLGLVELTPEGSPKVP